jgi:hypothetical protein
MLTSPAPEAPAVARLLEVEAALLAEQAKSRALSAEVKRLRETVAKLVRR